VTHGQSMRQYGLKKMMEFGKVYIAKKGGGINFYNKYSKYKLKYLTLKNKFI